MPFALHPSPLENATKSAHWVVGSALPPQDWGPDGQRALDELLSGHGLPGLSAFLARAGLGELTQTGAHSLTPPSEAAWVHAAASASKSPFPDGLVPWAAWGLDGAGLPRASAACGLITLCHWDVGIDDIVMQPPEGLGVTPAESAALFEAVSPYFAADGSGLQAHPSTAGLWFAQSELLRALPTASVHRASGQRVADWWREDAQAAPLRRLQNEMQMLLYTHPVNDAREALGLPTINSFWVSGTGEAPPASTAPSSTFVWRQLEAPARAGDPLGWQAAWHELDAALAHAPPQQLSLCSESAWRSCTRNTATPWQQLQRQTQMLFGKKLAQMLRGQLLN